MPFGFLCDNPIYARELARGGTVQWVMRILLGVYLGLVYLALAVIPLVAGRYTGVSFIVLYYLVMISSPLVAAWIPPALVGATLAGENERGTLAGIVLSTYPRRKVILGVLGARLRVVVLFALALVPFLFSPFLFLRPIDSTIDDVAGWFSPGSTLALPSPEQPLEEKSVLDEFPPREAPLFEKSGLRVWIAVLALWMVVYLLCEVAFSGSISLLCSLLSKNTAGAIGLSYVGVVFTPCLFGMVLAPIGLVAAMIQGPGNTQLSAQFTQQLIPQVLTVLFKVGVAAGALLYAERRLEQWDLSA